MQCSILHMMIQFLVLRLTIDIFVYRRISIEDILSVSKFQKNPFFFRRIKLKINENHITANLFVPS